MGSPRPQGTWDAFRSAEALDRTAGGRATGQAEGRRTDQGVDGRRWAFEGHRLSLPEPGGQLSQESEVSLEIYDGQGHLVGKLQLGWKEAGYYTTAAEAIYWDGRNANGESVSSGVCFYRLQARLRSQAGDYSQTRKMVILK